MGYLIAGAIVTSALMKNGRNSFSKSVMVGCGASEPALLPSAATPSADVTELRRLNAFDPVVGAVGPAKKAFIRRCDCGCQCYYQICKVLGLNVPFPSLPSLPPWPSSPLPS